MGQSLEAAARDDISRDALRSQGAALAEERLKLEEDLRDAEWRARNYASTAERRRTRTAALDILVTKWATLPFPDRQALLRELVDRILVTDDDVQVTLKP
jgi:hypothetical protein